MQLPAWIAYPEREWQRITPRKAGFDDARWRRFLASVEVRATNWGGEQHGANEFGVVLTRGGYLVHTWGDPDYRFQTASLGKAFTWVALGLAVDDGLIDPDAPVRAQWTGEGQLSHPHKYLDRGFHVNLTWRHLIGDKEDPRTRGGHYGGFPVTNGYYWRKGQAGKTRIDEGEVAGSQNWLAPEWAQWTGDPHYDNYSHAEPGSVRHYSSGGIWRLTQALTAVWGRDLKAVLDDRIFGPLGVPADHWDWLPGRRIFEDKAFYPRMPGYGDYVDPPYEIGGHPVRGGGGWVVMSASDLARFGHLVATQGVWKGHRLINGEWLRSHRGGNDSEVAGESTYYTAMGRVTARGIDHFGGVGRDPGIPFEELVVGPVSATG